MSEASLDTLYEFAKRVAVQSGDDILMRGFHSSVKDVQRKGLTDLVTKYDRASEEFIFSEIRSHFPAHAVIAEEGSRSESAHDLVWYVDPLDATTNFAHGIPHFCVSIAVFSRSMKRTVVGVVYDPNRKELFTAMTGCGASCNGKQIQVSGIDKLSDSIIATGFPYGKQDERINNLPQVNKILSHVQCLRRMGSAALDLCYVASGRFDGYWEPMLFPWDTAAGALIVEEAGGLVSDYPGEAFDPVVPEIVASNGLIHDALQDLVKSSTEHLPRTIAKRVFF
jgi:myo-inositol-1(or 4)-monophosphatase